MARAAPSQPILPTRASIGRRVLPFIAVVSAGLFAWWGVWNHGFLFDDNPAIVDNAPLLLGDWWNAAFAPPHQPLANRPLACLSLVVDFAVFGEGPFGPHLTNLLLHLGNAMLLLGVVRRALQAPNLAGRFDRTGATNLATVIAMVWVAHPLACDAVAYATQRSTLLFSALLLVCLYATLRAHGSPRRWRWQALAVVAMAFGMASKEDCITGPLLVVLFERAFLVPSWAVLRTRWSYYGALALTWGVLLACIVGGPRNPTVGYSTGLSVAAGDWLMTQASVVLHYVRLSAWPSPLRGAYDWDIVRNFGAAVLPGLGVLVLLGVVVSCWRKHPWWGWLGVLFFLLLAPTSTVLPIVTEIVAERRAYLPMLFVLVPAIVLLQHVLARLGPDAARLLGGVTTLGIVIALGLVARSHAAAYPDEATFWADAYEKRDHASRSHLASQILSNHGAMLFMQGQFEQAYPIFDVAMQCENPTSHERVHYAVSLQQRGRHAEALAELERALREAPDDPEVHGTLGTCLLQASQAAPRPGGTDERLVRAEAELRTAVALAPRRFAFWNSLGFVLQCREQWAAAEQAYRRATELSSERVEPFVNRADALLRLGRAAEIGPMFDRWLATRPEDVPLRLQLVQQAMQRKNMPWAMSLLRDVLRIDPSHAQAAAALHELEVHAPR